MGSQVEHARSTRFYFSRRSRPSYGLLSLLGNRPVFSGDVLPSNYIPENYTPVDGTVLCNFSQVPTCQSCGQLRACRTRHCWWHRIWYISNLIQNMSAEYQRFSIQIYLRVVLQEKRQFVLVWQCSLDFCRKFNFFAINGFQCAKPYLAWTCP